MATSRRPATTATATETRAPRSGLDGFFRISERGSTVGQEVRGGLVTFFTMAYIVVLNPLIIGNAPDVNGDLLAGGDFAVIAACMRWSPVCSPS